MSISLGACASSGAADATVAAALQFFAAAQCLLNEPYPRQADVTDGAHFDFIVVGGGSAGAALAARLAELPHYDVLLLEAGPDPPHESIVPGLRESLKGSRYDWNFTTVDDGYSSQELEGHHQKQPRGRMLGGSGSLNDMVYARGHPVDYEEWARAAGSTWNWTNVLPYFMRTERMTDARIVNNTELMKFHGTRGEIEVSGAAATDAPNTKLLNAFRELGFKLVDDMTYPYSIGAGRFSHTIRSGRRDSSLTALLNKVHNNNLHVLKNTLVTKILIENNTAVGVQALSDGKELFFYADKEVILSAGTFNTPKLLLLSGIGPKEVLAEFEIEAVQNLPVGEGLQDHVMVINFLAAENGTCERNERAQAFDVIKYLYDRTGFLSYSDSIGVYMPQNNKDPHVPYFAIYPSCVPQALITLQQCTSILGYTNETCVKLVKENEQHEIIVLPVVLLKPRSRGKVTLHSTDPTQNPKIWSGTFSDPADLDEFPDAIQMALSLMNTTYFREKAAHVVDITPAACACEEGAARLACAARAAALPAWHAVGTAALGAVLDARLRVRGLAGLRVADASVMPAVVRGNTNAPVVMLAEKAADFIKEDYQIYV
ncbi:ecdysone oxidase-like [Helicoverpa zea]|uniref:ecdysone oxidase-like n=1 Tax=Helicoverpa zea TaxID=7113 RepID=UPI001F5A5762|nr:ecdysone oxidase-like [Helicoverpa zea]